MSALQLNSYSMESEIKSYARTLYNNYRARTIVSGHPVPVWNMASPIVRREFLRNATVELGY